MQEHLGDRRADGQSGRMDTSPSVDNRARAISLRVRCLTGSAAFCCAFRTITIGQSMYAVIKTGGKQYRVAANEVIKVERLEAEEGSLLELDQVLMVGGDGSVRLGSPLLDGAKVTALVLEQGKGPKLTIFKKRRRKNSRRKTGHRQQLTVLRIKDIVAA
jgi:large subunit ribosomal protein L21